MSSTSDISDVDTDAEKQLLCTTDDESESPIKVATLYEKSTKIFSYNEINTEEYWREIRRILYKSYGCQYGTQWRSLYEFLSNF